MQDFVYGSGGSSSRDASLIQTETSSYFLAVDFLSAARLHEYLQTFLQFSGADVLRRSLTVPVLVYTGKESPDDDRPSWYREEKRSVSGRKAVQLCVSYLESFLCHKSYLQNVSPSRALAIRQMAFEKASAALRIYALISPAMQQP